MTMYEDNINKQNFMLEDENCTSVQNYTYIANNNSYYQNLYIPESFSKIVLTHIISLYMNNNHYYNPPMYLAIEGTPGEGKTVQTIGTCVRHKINILYVSASQLSGSHERDSIEIMNDIYQSAIRLKRNNKIVAILIDDFHLGNAIDDDNIKRTINSSLLTGYLMNLADNNQIDKIPIILTGNDYSKIYAPLLRAGRADRFMWMPSFFEKKCIVENIFKDFVCYRQKDYDKFFNKYSYLSIAEFSQLKNEFRKKILFESISNHAMINIKSISDIQSEFDNKRYKINLKELEALIPKNIKMKRRL